MLEASWLLFVLASRVVITTPGQGMILVMSRSLAQGPGCRSSLRRRPAKGAVGLFTGTLSEWLRRRPAALSWIYRASGAFLIGLGLKLALERRSA